MNTQQYRGNQTTGLLDTSRGPSPAIWAECPVLELLYGNKDGIYHFDDFVSGPRVPAGAEAVAGLYRGFADTGGLVADAGEFGGVLTLSSDGDNEGASFRMSGSPFQVGRNQGKLWMEARVRTTTIADTKHGIFVGLMADNALTAVLPITAAGAIADVNIVGFHRLEGDGDYFDTVYKADGVTQVTVQADAAVIVADTWVKLGMVFDPAKNLLSFYRNGVRLATTYTMASASGTDFPNDVRMGFVVAVLNATASTPGSSSIDWVRIAQLAP